MVIDAQAPGANGPSSHIGVSWSSQALLLHDDEVFGMGGATLCDRFLRRIFAVPQVRSVAIDRHGSTAQIRFDRGTLSMAELLNRLAGALRSDPDGSAPTQITSLLPSELGQPNLTIYRHRGVLSTWEVVGDHPGALTLRHKLLSTDSALSAWLVRQVESVPGVRRGEIRPLSRTLKIHFDPAQARTERLLRVLESSPDLFRREPAHPTASEPVRFGLVNTAMALSVVSDFLVPSVWPATAALLIGSNLRMFRTAATQLGNKQFGLPVLYTAIAAGTLATRQFLPWAAMNWMLKYWKHRYQQDLERSRRRLLGEVIQRERFARVEAKGGIELEVPVERLLAGDVILVSTGEKLPVDGRIIKGNGLVDERIIRGTSGMTRKSPDQTVDAGTIVVAGELQVETLRHGMETRAATLGRLALTAANQPLGTKTPTVRGEEFAERVVAPSLAAAGLGLAVGGVPTALAILDTDYASGLGLAHPLESLQALSLCFEQGIVVRDAGALDTLAKIDVILLDDHPALDLTDPEVASVRVFPGHTEFQVLQYAATALCDLNDERATALRAECLSRRIALLDELPTNYGTDVMLIHRGQLIKVGNLGGHGPLAEQMGGRPQPQTLDSLMVGVNGQIAGLVDFQRSSRPRAAPAIEELRIRARRPLAVGLVSKASDSRLREAARALGVDFHHGGLGPGDLAQLIRGCQRRGLKVAYVGHCLHKLRAAREADLAISLDPDGLENLDQNPASILLLQPDLFRLGVLLEVARIHRRKILTAQGSSILPNFFCVAGALFLGFSSLLSVFITNLGTYSTYARTSAGIRGLERQLARTRRRRSSGAAG
jgi:Cu2+-exporting ATPase